MPRPRRSPLSSPRKRKRPKTAKPRPSGLQLWLYRVPSYIYRARLGFILGKRFLMIEHRGRKSGNLYHTVVEVAGRTAGAEWVVTSGYGPTADWYRNLRSGGLEGIWIGSTRHRAAVRFLSNIEAAEVMEEYERAHPRMAEILMREMNVSYDGSDEGRVDMMKKIPMVAFTVKG